MRLLRRAVELGVDFIDTAGVYGPHVSEKIIREAPHPYPEHVLITTKGGRTQSGPGSAASPRRSVPHRPRPHSPGCSLGPSTWGPGTASMAHLEENIAAATVRLDPARFTGLNTPAG
ncbi:aldo/keto reductase [Streptomyces sp. x-80]|uniref:aldo/keto reductase n=1 Tax=Streptomyces sp. x-80 TaxID=2789282 RepID=UPI00397F0BFD